MLSRPDEIREGIRSIVLSIKPLADGFSELDYDAPLFSDGSGSPSPINLDSLDALDLAMSIGDEFDLDNDEFEHLVESESGLANLRTVNDITTLVISLLAENGQAQTKTKLQGKEVTA